MDIQTRIIIISLITFLLIFIFKIRPYIDSKIDEYLERKHDEIDNKLKKDLSDIDKDCQRALNEK